MGTGANYGLDKGFVVEGTNPVTQFKLASMGVASQSCKATVAAGDATVLGVFQETIDTAKLTANQGKVYADVRMLGLSNVVVGAAVAKNDLLTSDASGRAVKQATAGSRAFGVAMEAATAANQVINVLLTPGVTA